MKYWKITYSNGYCGCDEEEYIEAETIEEAEDEAEDGLTLYSFFDPDDRFVDENEFDTIDEYYEAFENYQADISYEVEEITKKEYDESCWKERYKK